MNALILAAGYATRLYPLTLHKAKPLLEVAGKPMIEWVLDNLAPVPDLETVYVVTNNKFVKDFQTWAETYRQTTLEIRAQDHRRRIDRRLGQAGRDWRHQSRPDAGRSGEGRSDCRRRR